MEVFRNVVCGVDGSLEGLAAARLAARVADPAGDLTLLAVEDMSAAVHAGFVAPQVLEDVDRVARRALDEGRAATATLHSSPVHLRTGGPVESFLAALDERGATLAVAGMHHRRRAVGIIFGSVCTALLHEAPCSVLVARATDDVLRWPRSIVVGVDGSPESAAAHAAALHLARRFGATVRSVIARDDDGPDLVGARLIAPDLEEHDARPLDLLAVLAERADLVVVGSRGVKGLRALGSVSERLAHCAQSPVLVVRGRGATVDPGKEH